MNAMLSAKSSSDELWGIGWFRFILDILNLDEKYLFVWSLAGHGIQISGFPSS
jgi:hypothetical protein